MNKSTRLRCTQALLRESLTKYPNLPEQYHAISKVSDSDTNSLTKCIINWLRCNGHQAERVSNTGRWIDQSKIATDVLGRKKKIGTGKWIKGSGTNGTADIHAQIVVRWSEFAIPVKIEVKFGKDRQSDAQRAYQAEVERKGGVYVIAKDMDTFMEWYDSFIKARP